MARLLHEVEAFLRCAAKTFTSWRALLNQPLLLPLTTHHSPLTYEVEPFLCCAPKSFTS